MDELAAGAWAKFLHAVFDAFRDAEGLVRSQEYWDDHRKKNGAFLKAAKGKAYRLPAEEGLTHALYECLWLVKVRSNPGHPLRDLAVEFHSEAKMPSPRRTGKKARRTDIWARSSKYEDAPEIVFEAKLLGKKRDISRYLGRDGLGCFIGPDEPYTRKQLGGLLAYTIDKTQNEWFELIGDAMVGPPAVTLSQHAISIGHLPENIICSRVERPLLGIVDPIAMLHLVMKFPTEPPIINS